MPDSKSDSKRFLLRLDPDTFEALRRWADDDLRSINAQIEFLLSDQLRRAGRLPGAHAAKEIDVRRTERRDAPNPEEARAES